MQDQRSSQLHTGGRSFRIGPPPGPAPVVDGPPAALLGVLRADLLLSGRRCPPALAVLFTFSLMVLILALYTGLCVAIFKIS